MSETPRTYDEALDKSELLNEFSREGQELIQKIKEKGLHDPEVTPVLTEWAKKEEALAEKTGAGKPDVEFTIKRGKLLYLAGCIDEALENFKDAADAAYQLFDEELENRAAMLYDQVDRSRR